MPGPTSDAYDPEFGTAGNCADVCAAADAIHCRISKLIGPNTKEILSVVHGEHGPGQRLEFTEKELRIIRFCLDRAQETI